MLAGYVAVFTDKGTYLLLRGVFLTLGGWYAARYSA